MAKTDECENCHAEVPVSELRWVEDEVSGDWLECRGCRKADTKADPEHGGTR
jgi:hypothetical protein